MKHSGGKGPEAPRLRSVLAHIAEHESTLALRDALADGPGVHRLTGVAGSLGAVAIAAGWRQVGRGTLLCVAATQDEAAYHKSDILVTLDALSDADTEPDVLLLAPSGLRPFDRQQSSAFSAIQERMDVVLQIEEGFQGVLVASAESLVERIPPPAILEAAAPTLRVGDVERPENFVERLVGLGFSVEEFVGDPGEIAFRGGIVDVFPFVGDYPIRVEFFGDEIDSIREFDPDTQRSISRVVSARLMPDPGELPPDARFGTVLDYLPEDAPIVLFESDRVASVQDELFKRAETRRSEVAATAENPEVLPRTVDRYCEFADLERDFHRRAIVKVNGGAGGEIDFASRPAPVFNKAVKLVKEQIKRNDALGLRTTILCDGRGQLGRLEELLGTADVEARFSLVLATLHRGFEMPSAGLAVYTDHEIFNRYHRPSAGKRKRRGQKMSVAQLRSLSPGDFVVHVDHGIGRFAGMQKKVVRGRTQEVVKLLYQGDDILFVNVNSLHRLDKFSSREGHVPRLTRLGSGQWERVKSKTKQRVKDIARGLIKLYAQRKSADGFGFSADSVWQQELEASFRYEDTPDQYQAAEDVKSDMQQPVPMDRLVCGDVGFGKTEVAVRAAFKAVQDGKQVGLLVPTTILASQHFDTFKERLEPYAVKVEVLSRFRSAAEQKAVVRDLADGKVDIVIGTQRLVSKDIKFRDLGLLIVDEEQRFGVAVKEKLRALRAQVDTLTLTATPIPRTLQFSLMGARDLSIINTPPPNRQPIVTEIHSWDTRIVRDAILYEVNRGGQVFFIHNRVRTIDQTAASLEALVEGVRFRVAHGQMRPSELEDVMQGFIDRRFDVLVSTNIVESGLDVANANTMIIDRADRFGLADLHQLRGRVGRSDRRAFCYLFVPSVHTLTREARHRLRAIEEFSELGSGFNIAMRDLDIRGAGNLLGAEQSGFIDEIGYETYHRILDEAVTELRRDEFRGLFEDAEIELPPIETTVDLEVEALIPAAYVGQASERLDLYRRLAEAKTPERIDDIANEMGDRFGETPPEVDSLLVASKIRIAAQELRLPKVEFKRSRLFLTIPPQKDTRFYESVFQPLLERLTEMPNRYVIKEMGTKTKLIIQEVVDLDACTEILASLTQEPVESN